jgi:hypothetical protein
MAANPGSRSTTLLPTPVNQFGRAHRQLLILSNIELYFVKKLTDMIVWNLWLQFQLWKRLCSSQDPNSESVQTIIFVFYFMLDPDQNPELECTPYQYRCVFFFLKHSPFKYFRYPVMLRAWGRTNVQSLVFFFSDGKFI